MKNNDYGSNRLIGIDILRIMSVLVVFCFHSIVHINCNYGLFNSFFKMGAIFMTAFFMLSGFILFHLYGKKIC